MTISKRLLCSIISTLLLLGVGGCYPDGHWEGPVQIEQSGQSLEMIVARGTLWKYVSDPMSWVTGIEYRFLSFSLDKTPCPMEPDRDSYNASVGMGRVLQSEDERVDFFFGAIPKRLVRVRSFNLGKRLEVDVAILGIDSKDQHWKMLRHYGRSSQLGKFNAATTPHGRYVVISKPTRVIDVASLTETEDPAVSRMVVLADANQAALATDFIFSDDLKYLECQTGILMLGPEPVKLGAHTYDHDSFTLNNHKYDRLSNALLIDSATGICDACPNDTVPIVQNGAADVFRWEDLALRSNSTNGLWGNMFLSQDMYAHDPAYCWDVRAHKATTRPSTNESCEGFRVCGLSHDGSPMSVILDIKECLKRF